jgi:hypothetical protein
MLNGLNHSKRKTANVSETLKRSGAERKTRESVVSETLITLSNRHQICRAGAPIATQL